jgi:hypothetical protein
MMVFLDTDGRLYHVFFVGEPRRVSLFLVSIPASCRQSTGVSSETAGALDAPQTGSSVAHNHTHANRRPSRTKPGSHVASLTEEAKEDEEQYGATRRVNL